MKSVWWIFAIMALAVGTFLWHGRQDVPVRMLFDNMRKQNDSAPSYVSPQAHAASIGDAPSGDPSLVFASKFGSYFQTGKVGEKFGDSLPREMGESGQESVLLRQGEWVYGRYCLCCHGVEGDGKGAMSTYVEFPVIAAFGSEKYKDYPAGKIFRSIADGQGNMPSFADRMPAQEIWEVVIWVMELRRRCEEKNKEDVQ